MPDKKKKKERKKKTQKKNNSTTRSKVSQHVMNLEQQLRQINSETNRSVRHYLLETAYN